MATLAVALAASAYAPSARAEEGQAEAKKEPIGITLGAGVGVANFDAFDTNTFAWRIQASYAPCKWFGAEIEWLDLGTPNNKFSGMTQKVEMAAGGFNLSAMPIIPIGDDWKLFGKLGGYFWDANFEGDSGGDWSIDMSFGAGITYNLFPSIGIGVKAEWTRVMLEVEPTNLPTGYLHSFTDDVDIVTFGAFYQI